MSLRQVALLLGLLVVGVAASGCSGDDKLDKAAAPATSTDKAPPAVPGKKISKMPPLTGPNAGKGGMADP